MKKILPLFFLFILMATFSQAQMCDPDATIPDSIVITPVPFDTTDMTGGIPDTACLDNYYETTFTFRIPEMLDFNGFPVRVDSVLLDPNNQMSVVGLPDGISWSCNPGNCLFNPRVDTLSCILLFGTPTNAAQIGDNPITINATFYSSLGLPQTVPFPNQLIPGADGQYALALRDNNFGNCATVGTDDDVFKSSLSIEASPNPFGYTTNIKVNADSNRELQFAVFNVLGRMVQQRNLNLPEGETIIEFDGSELPEGVYLYALTDGQNILTKKMIIQR